MNLFLYFSLIKNKFLKFFISHLPVIKNQKRGFTLIELLVSIVISSIVLSSLLAFMNNILNSERREQVKAITEQEIQSALDYVADDLQEAIYIYDAEGLAKIKNQLPQPEAQNRVPVLVFWKRSFLSRDSELQLNNGTVTKVGCLARIPGTNNCNERDYYVYSLVAYYLIKDNEPQWSNNARIGRLEIQDGIRNPYNPKEYLADKVPDPGFQLFDLTLPGSLKEKMNAWQKNNRSSYDLAQNPIEILVDYIDISRNDDVPLPLNCQSISPQAQQVPASDSAANLLQMYSFYACVDSARNLARVYMRGNALARIERDATYSNNQSGYFPKVSVQVQSRGILSN